MSIKKGLVAITSEVLEDVKREAEEIIRDAEKKAEEILRKAKEEAEEARERLLNEAKEKGEIDKRKIESLTEMEMRNKLLKAKEELVNAAFDKTLIRLSEFAQTESYYDYLLKLITEAVQKIDSGTVVVHVTSKDREWLVHNRLDDLSRELRVRLILADEPQDCIGGCIIEASHEKIFYDNTFENRLKLLKPVLRMKIAKMFFEKEG